MDVIRLFVVDDDPIWLKGIIRFLDKETTFQVVGSALNKDEALQKIEDLEIDITLMDLNLGTDCYDGLELSQDILRKKNLKIIILTSISEASIIPDAFAVGAVNYFCKDNIDSLPLAIRSCYNNISPIEILGKEFSRIREENRLNILTFSEREVFDLKKKGYTLKEIGDFLHKSPSTLKKQMNNILKKLNLKRFKDLNRIRK